MSGYKVLFVIAVVLQLTVARRCEKITDKTAPLCANLSQGWDSMTLPNLAGHDTVDEVRTGLAQWSPLVYFPIKCHPYLKHFLCSVYTPVCIVASNDIMEPIGPCMSLCSMVQKSCEPLMRQHNYTWPAMLNCSKYKEDDMCVRITASPTTELPTPAPSVCVDDDDTKISTSVFKKKFCEADFAFRGRVSERKDRAGVIILKMKVSSQLKSTVKGTIQKGKTLRLRVPISGSSQCTGAQRRKQFLVFGKFKRGKKMVVTHLLKWKKWKRHARKLSKRSCRKY